jgi:hypothetical protein
MKVITHKSCQNVIAFVMYILSSTVGTNTDSTVGRTVGTIQGRPQSSNSIQNTGYVPPVFAFPVSRIFLYRAEHCR